MSWKRTGALQTNLIVAPERERHAQGPKIFKDKEVSYERVDSEIIATDMIESTVLMINNKNMIVTSDRVNIHTPENNLIIPNSGCIKINNACHIYQDDLLIPGNISVKGNFLSKTNTPLVMRIPIEKPSITFSNKNFNVTNHFVLDCPDKVAKTTITVMPYRAYSSYWSDNNLEYLYQCHFYINTSDSECLVDIDVRLHNQDEIVKLHSRQSSLSLMWLPEGKWIINSLGFKTKLILNE